jgi:hypothetical protein
MMELKFKDDTNRIIQDVLFDGNVRSFYEHKFPYGHEDLAKYIAESGMGVFSVLIITERLEYDLYNDPNHCVQTNSLCISQAREEARKQLMNKYYSSEQLKEMMEKYDLKTWETNAPEKRSDEADRKFKLHIEDALFEAQEMLLLPEIIESKTYHSKLRLDAEGYPVENEDGDYIELGPEDEALQKKQYEEELEKILMPRVMTKYDRRALMPHPFNWWDWRNGFQQYFFIKDGDSIYCDHGGSGSSGRRETQGRMAHTFATLSEKYGIEAKTLFFRYDRKNQMVYLDSSDTFKAMNRELSGNYDSDYKVVKELFKGRLVMETGQDDEVRGIANITKDDFYG